MFGRFSARPAVEFGDRLARRFAELYPPALDRPGAPQISANRLSRILEGLYAEAQIFNTQHNLGYYRRTRLSHAFKWRLMELGYSKPLIETATEGLIVYLHKPAAPAPELERAERKRARKAERNRGRASGDASPRG